MSTQVLHEVMTEPFTVYTAKNFPGMTGGVVKVLYEEDNAADAM